MKPQVILLDMINEHHDGWDRPTAGWGQTGQWDSQWETSAAAPAQERRGKRAEVPASSSARSPSSPVPAWPGQ
ncbi:hypothetical protein QP028_10770 [Corynebacterium suedekumii]|nr:hypothetical protein QP028_10770 [Corynebacterium suedekumii]